MPKKLRLSVLAALTVSLGCGGVSEDVIIVGGSTSKQPPTTFELNNGLPKNGTTRSATAVTVNISESNAFTEVCIGGPPLLPVGDLDVAPLQNPFIPVSEQELWALPDRTVEDLALCTSEVQSAYPALEVSSDLGFRTVVDTLKTFTPQRTREPSADSLTDPEWSVIWRYWKNGSIFSAYRVRSASTDAFADAARLFPQETLHNGQGDAFRHAWWNILLGKRIGPDFAAAFTEAHEAGNPDDPAREQAMDRHNNRIGISIIQANRSESEADLLRRLQQYIVDNPMVWTDGNNVPGTQALVYLEPPPPPAAPGEIVVREDQDAADGHPGFHRAGTPKYWWRSTNFGLDGGMWFTYSNGGNTDNVGTWRPDLPQSRDYSVYVFIPRRLASTRNAIYQVHAANGRHDVRVIQFDIYDEWHLLGRFPFAAGTGGFVRLADNTGEPVQATYIGFDSVKWVAN